MKPQALFIAQSTYTAEVDHKKIWDDLPLAAEEASELAADLASHGYELSRQDLLKGGEKRAIEDALNDWVAHVADGSRVILFWTGHGCSEGGRHYLVCRNSPKVGITSHDAISPDLIGEFIAKCNAEKILIILDTCYSGDGARQIVSVLEGILATRLSAPGQQRAFAIIASAHPLEEAQEAVFSKALRAAFFESNLPPNKRIWTDKDEFITADDLAVVACHLMPPGISSPQCKASGLGQRFIPNPRYLAGLPAENVEERLWRLARSDAADHFELAARGIEVGEKGWFFSGRRQLLGRLVDWLNTAEHGVRIVTGPPGAGKSALMGRLATLSDAQYRQEAIDAGVVKEGEDVIPPVEVIDVAVHAKGKTLEDCARALAKGLGVEIGQDVSVDVERLVDKIGKLDRKITLMADALDEAAGGKGATIATRLIVPLGSLPRVRVLVGTRRSLDGAVIPEGEYRHGRLHAAFGAGAIIDDLEDEPETHDDIAAYGRLRLRSSAKHHSDAPGNLADVADRVATKADGIFLYARIVSRTLQDRDQLVGDLPATVLEAFEQDLSVRFEGNERRVNDLLGALAWGEGKGLTRRVWPLIANALVAGDRPYDDDDIAWVLGHAGWHITEAGEDGQTVYRLAHQALADHYHGKFDEKKMHGRFVTALTDGIAGAGWLDCDRYLWRHLSDHAAKADCLDVLIHDPSYLAVADPARLALALPSVKSAEGRRFATLYNRVVDRLVDVNPIDRMPLIHMTAQMEDPELGPGLEPPAPTRWKCRWARVRPSTPHQVIGKHDGSVNSVAFGMIDRKPVVVSGSSDKTVQLWDARTGEAIGEPLKGHASAVTSVAFGAIERRPVVLSGSSDNTIRLWDAQTGQPIGAPLNGETRSISSLAFGAIDGRTVIVLGSGDGTIQRREARTGEPIGAQLKGHIGSVSSLTFGAIDGRLTIVSGSWGRAIRLWDARTGEPIGAPLEGHTGPVTSLALGAIDDRPTIVSGGSYDKIIRLWDARTGEPIGAPLQGHSRSVTSVAFGAIDGRPVVVSGSDDNTVWLWDARTGKPISAPLKGHLGSVTSVAFGMIDGRPVVVSGSHDGTIRLWDAPPTEPIGAPIEGHTNRVTSVAFGAIDGRPIVLSGSEDYTIRLWDARTGQTIGAPLEGHGTSVTSVAFGAISGRPIVVSKGGKSVRLWDARTGESIGAPIEGHATVIDGRPVVVSGSEDYTIRLRDSRTGETIGAPIEGYAITFGEIDGRPVVVSESSDRTLGFWDVRTGKPIGAPLKEVDPDWVFPVALGVTSIRFGAIDGRPVVAVQKNWPGTTIRLWDVWTGEPIGEPIEGLASWGAFAFGAIDGRPVVVSGSPDGTVRLCDARTDQNDHCLAITIHDPIISIDTDGNTKIVVGLARGILLLEVFAMPQK